MHKDRSVAAPAVPLTCGIVGLGLGFLHHYYRLPTKLATLASSSLPID
jgi:ribose/xylose/arabinose/galactoside ABC-type transport system permease subunit